MPSFNVDIEFEVFCGTCGTGLCNNSETRTSRNRSANQVTVDACPKCMAAKDEEISDLNYKVDALETEMENLRTELQNAKTREQ